MNQLSFPQFQIDSPLAIDDAWQRLFSVTDQGSVSSFTLMEHPGIGCATGSRKYGGKPEGYKFKLTPLKEGEYNPGTRVRIIISGRIERHPGGCSVKATVRPSVPGLILLTIFGVLFISMLCQLLLDGLGRGLFGFVVIGGVLGLRLGLWIAAWKRQREAFYKLFDGRPPMTPLT